MTKEEIADTLEAIAQLLDLKGENPFKIRAYQTAARAIETYAGNLDEVAAKGELGEIEGVGKAIAEKIGELVETGRLGYFEELKGSFPPQIFELFEINGLGAKKIKALHDKLGVASLDDLEKACRDGRVAGLAGFGEKDREEPPLRDRATAAQRRVSPAGRRGGSGVSDVGRVARTPRRVARERGREFPAAQGSGARPGFRRVHARAEGGGRFFRHAPGGGGGHRPRADEGGRAVEGRRHPMRPAAGQRHGISLRAAPFHGQQGAPHRAAQPRAGTRLVDQRIPDQRRARETRTAARGPRRGGILPRAGHGLHRARVARKPRRDRRRRGGQAARSDRTGQPARDVPLPHHRQRRPQHAGGNGGGGARPGAAIPGVGRPQQEFLPGQRPG